MAEQVQKIKERRAKLQAEVDTTRQQKQMVRLKESPSTHTAEMLAEIDGILEEVDAETFVRQYVQRGGQ